MSLSLLLAAALSTTAATAVDTDTDTDTGTTLPARFESDLVYVAPTFVDGSSLLFRSHRSGWINGRCEGNIQIGPKRGSR